MQISQKVGKRTLILKLLLKHLDSDTLEESKDQGFSTFLKIHLELESVLGGKTNIIKSEPLLEILLPSI